MTYFPRNARSEFVEPTNRGDGGEADTSLRFQIASAAGVMIRLDVSALPGRSPTRGSGFGAVAEVATIVFAAGTAAVVVVDVDEPQAAVEMSAAPTRSWVDTDFIADLS